MRKLETLLDDFAFDALPPLWTTFDLRRFSKTKRLWDYQQTALENAIKTLWKYYEDCGEFEPAETAAANQGRKARLMQWYVNNNIPLEAFLPLGRKRDYAALLGAYYPLEAEGLPYERLINRMGFWMATGSGKTVVIVKLIEVLWALMQRGEIPANDVLVLTHREDLLRQLRQHVDEFNTTGSEVFIRLRDLKEYPAVKRSFPTLLAHQEITVFYYRSDNLSDEQKERIIDFRNYDNNGRWYVLLDEAHKGDKEDSKRQHIYNILSREGFLFNFSATFTDDRDKLTTAAEFNLSSYIEAGYGKHIAILKQENRAFRHDEDFTDEEKQKIVLQSLLMLAYISKAGAGLREAIGDNLYHRPLLMALVNSVNVDDADLKLFFTQLECIARGQLSKDAFTRAKADLGDELRSQPEWLYENACFTPDLALFNSLTIKDVLSHIFNADSHGEIEVLRRPSNDKELAFKLKSTTAPFALIRIGDTREWVKDMLAGYSFVEGFEDESFFERINANDTEITLLMGSRSFYEGWDSNRPNVITFINIGTGTDARKFVLQSVGRGARIEPLRGKRRRLASLVNAGEIDDLLFQQAKPFLPAIESLFIFGTNRTALESVFKELDQEKDKPEGVEIALEVNPVARDGRLLLVPTYRIADRPLIEQRAPTKFELPQAELELLRNYIDYLGDERLLLARHDLSPRQIGSLQKSLAEPDIYFNMAGGRKYGKVDILLPRLTGYLDIRPSQLEGFKPLGEEINHYRHIRVLLRDIEELQKRIRAVQDYQDPALQRAVLREKRRIGEIDDDAYDAGIERMARASSEDTFTPAHGASLKIKNIAAHYYVPLLLSEDDQIDYIRHVIHVGSEVHFIQQLERYLGETENQFKVFDWWMFSRCDESLDQIVIPYYDPSQNKMRNFHPDFIFWLQRGKEYFILFVDPKGMVNSDYQYKVDGYEEIFVDQAIKQLRVFPYGDMQVRVALAMFNTGASASSQGYRDYWYDSPKGILKHLVAS